MRIVIPRIPPPSDPPKTGEMPLRSAFWRDVKRLQEAKTQPYRSLLEGRDTGTEALHRFQSALLHLRGRPNAFGQPYCYDIPANEHPSESARCYFGTMTRRAVTAFQQQTKLGADGIAGQTTLKHVDALLVTHYDSSLPAAPPSGGGGGGGSGGGGPSTPSTQPSVSH